MHYQLGRGQINSSRAEAVFYGNAIPIAQSVAMQMLHGAPR